MMKKRFALAIALIGGSFVIHAGSLPGTRANSSYIGKKWVAFELNNGPSYKWKKLPDGGSLQYWRSDIAGCCTGRYENGQGNRCDLLVRLDKNKVIREVRILERGMACSIALR